MTKPVRNIIGGDRTPHEEGQKAPWDVKEGKEGEGETGRPHIFVTVSEVGLRQGLTVTTTRRSYYLTLQSVKQASTRVLRWTYTPEPPRLPMPAETPGLLPHPETPAHYHVGYQLAAYGPPPAWMPRQVLDDGKKLYILYPEVTLFGTVPLLRLIGPNGPQLVNSRQYLNVVIVDQLVAKAELRVGVGETAETVTITRGQLRTITCPSDEDCPRWPQAATTRAGR